MMKGDITRTAASLLFSNALHLHCTTVCMSPFFSRQITQDRSTHLHWKKRTERTPPPPGCPFTVLVIIPWRTNYEPSCCPLSASGNAQQHAQQLPPQKSNGQAADGPAIAHEKQKKRGKRLHVKLHIVSRIVYKTVVRTDGRREG